MERYPNISDHGLIGDLQTAALVSTDGTIDWFCCPRFDSPSIFASLLDADKGGYFRIAPDTSDYVSRQLYFPDTAILITRFMTPDGVGEVIDFMPVAGGQAHRPAPAGPDDAGRPRHDALRDGVQAAVRLRPRPTHKLEITEDGVVFRAGRHGADAEPGGRPRCRWASRRGDRRAASATTSGISRTLQEGEIGGVVLETVAAASPGGCQPDELEQLFEETARLLARLDGPVHLHGPLAGDGGTLGHDAQADDVRAHRRAGRRADRRAARAGRRGAQLGLPLHLDPGRVVLGVRAARAGLHRGGRRASCAGCATAFSEARAKAPQPLQIMYRVDGSSDLTEETLDHFEGYRGSSPVRIGNGAADQLQLDIYGEALDAIYLADAHGLRPGARGLDATWPT